jgi:hypothetical protein
MGLTNTQKGGYVIILLALILFFMSFSELSSIFGKPFVLLAEFLCSLIGLQMGLRIALEVDEK